MLLLERDRLWLAALLREVTLRGRELHEAGIAARMWRRRSARARAARATRCDRRRSSCGKYRHRASTLKSASIALKYRSLSIIDVLILGSVAEYRLNIGSVSLSIG